LINNCHNADCRIIAQRLEDKSVKVIFLDAPYGRYGKYKEGRHNPDAASIRNCDNMSTEAVKQLLDDMFRLLADKVADGGVMLLCRPGGIADPLHYYITSSIERYGWETSNILVWDKGKIQLGDGKAPYNIDNETIWVIHRKGDKIENHNGSSPKTVLRFSAVAQRSMTVNMSHLFAKPIDLCKFLIQKHSFEGEVIFDACGCSGNFSIAALELNRQFIYSETNKVNYELGRQMVFDALRKQEKRAI
jgi:DNA modification methylase